jgi:Trm5-related predicted tRNA methylase
MDTNTKDLIYRLRKRAEIRRQITTRKSVIEGQPDRIADLLEEAAKAIEDLETERAWIINHGFRM